MTNKRRLIWGCGLAVMVLVVVVERWTRPGPTWRNFNRLREGMTLSEVEAIMGSPSADAETAAVGLPDEHPDGLVSYQKWLEQWRKEVSRVRLWELKGKQHFYTHFDKAGRLSKKYGHDFIKGQDF